MNFIVVYEVLRLSLLRDGGKDIVLSTFADPDAAIKMAKRLSQKEEGICVIEARYATQKNLENHFCFDSFIVWAEWLNKEDS